MTPVKSFVEHIDYYVCLVPCYCSGDLKLENIMLVSAADDSPVKVIDFGMMVRLPESDATTYIGTSAVGSPGLKVFYF